MAARREPRPQGPERSGDPRRSGRDRRDRHVGPPIESDGFRQDPDGEHHHARRRVRRHGRERQAEDQEKARIPLALEELIFAGKALEDEQLAYLAPGSTLGQRANGVRGGQIHTLAFWAEGSLDWKVTFVDAEDGSAGVASGTATGEPPGRSPFSVDLTAPAAPTTTTSTSARPAAATPPTAPGADAVRADPDDTG